MILSLKTYVDRFTNYSLICEESGEATIILFSFKCMAV